MIKGFRDLHFMATFIALLLIDSGGPWFRSIWHGLTYQSAKYCAIGLGLIIIYEVISDVRKNRKLMGLDDDEVKTEEEVNK